MNPESSCGRENVHRIGIVVSTAPKLHTPGLRYLLLKLNSLQRVFEYELLPNDMPQSPLRALDCNRHGIDRKEIRDKKLPEFLVAYREFLWRESEKYDLKEDPPNNFIFISLGTFDDGYYSTRPSFELTLPNRMSVLALGNWEKAMAPPSILEFILTLVIRESVAFVSPSLQGSIHLGTKGCICDFTAKLEEAKYKALNGFVCGHCRAALAADGFPGLADDISRILEKRWLGRRSDPSSVAGILAHLQHDLFITKGLSPSWREKLRKVLTEEGTKQFVDIAGKIALGLILLYLSIHGVKIQPTSSGESTGPSTPSSHNGPTTTQKGDPVGKLSQEGR